jgi:hypothetical protein
VLLGDIIEFREGPVRDALAAASRVLPELGGALGSGREVVIVPGNHDHHLVEGWLRRRAAAGPPDPLGLESPVDWWGGEPLAAVADMLAEGGAEVRAAYPGVWLRKDTYATHGHYLDRHTTVPMFERLGAGVMARVLRRPAEQAQSAEDYEAVLAPLYALIHEVAQSGRAGAVNAPRRVGTGSSAQVWAALGRGFRSGTVRQRALMAGAGGTVALLNRGGIGPVRSDFSSAELRRAGLRAFAEVLDRLGVECRYALFGHTHRAGPLPPDDPAEWQSAGGTQIVNAGCWAYEPILLGDRPQASPYRAGFAVWLEEGDGPPRLVNLLDEPPSRPDPAPA